jgi:hypothetical protein
MTQANPLVRFGVSWLPPTLAAPDTKRVHGLL